MTRQEIDRLIALERSCRLLSGDLLDQEDLFRVQEELCRMMVDSANRNPAIGETLERKLPHLFRWG